MPAKSSISTAKKIAELDQSEDNTDRIYAKVLSQAIDKRISLGISQVELGQKSGLAGHTISRIERVDTQITIKTFLKYLDALDMEYTLKEPRS